MNLKETIKQTINESTGIKGVELITKVLRITQEQQFQFTQEYFFSQLESLIEENEIVEVEYTLPAMDYRTKSIYFPKGTTIKVVD